VEVRHLLHKTCSVTIENFNEQFKGIFDGYISRSRSARAERSRPEPIGNRCGPPGTAPLAAMGIVAPIDQMQVARPAVPGAHGQPAGQVRLGPGREGRRLLVPDVDPLEIAARADAIGEAVEAVAGHVVDPPHRSVR
jgi:hypothetical protein